jgi:SAM-dependent methyltransferase
VIRSTAESINVPDARLRACLEDGPPDIGTVWELCMYFEFRREETADGIAEWLGPADGLRILDCACGSGFPAIELTRRGYDVTCTDGSDMMLRHFRRNARLDGVDLEPERVLWEDLPARHGEQFDVVLNRGCGNYRYAGVWDGGGLADRRAMVDAIGEWVACVRPGGRFYVDIPRDVGPAEARPEVTEHPTMLIGDHTVHLAELITIDPGTGIRTWHTWLTVDGACHEFERRAHHIRHRELVDILTNLGMADVHQVDIRGEYYDIYCAIRPHGGQRQT